VDDLVGNDKPVALKKINNAASAIAPN